MGAGTCRTRLGRFRATQGTSRMVGVEDHHFDAGAHDAPVVRDKDGTGAAPNFATMASESIAHANAALGVVRGGHGKGAGSLVILMLLGFHKFFLCCESEQA